MNSTLLNAFDGRTAEVIQAEESEAELIERARSSHSQSAWTVGECAARWTQKYARGRSDADFGKLIGMTQQDVNKRRLVWERFGGSYAIWRNLSWSHFREAVCWPDADEILGAADVQRMTVDEMRCSRGSNHAQPIVMPLPGAPPESFVTDLAELDDQKFGTIYADPPWKYGNQGTRAATDNHYPTMTVDEICEMPVADLAADDAHLHLWTTVSFLFDAKQVMDAWGFEYRSMLVWCKPQIGLGNYWRVSHELLLLGVRGNARQFNSRDKRSWIQHDRQRHSEKPEEVRELIENVSSGPYLELFGRKLTDGWATYGNEVLS